MPESQNVVITDFTMPFGSMVWFILKWAIASIPAMLILGGVGMFITMFFGILASMFGHGMLSGL